MSQVCTKVRWTHKRGHGPPSRALAAVIVAALSLVAWARGDAGETTATMPPGETLLIGREVQGSAIKVMANKSVVLQTNRPYKRVSTAQSEIADVNPVGEKSILLTGKKAGTTQMVVWDDTDRCQMVDVTVESDLQGLLQQMKTMFPGSKIEVGSANGAIVLRGHVPSLTAAEQAVQVASPYASKVLNFLEVSGGQQVMLQVRFAEVSRSATSALGVNFGFADGRSFAGSNIGQVNPLGIKDLQDGVFNLGVQSPNPAVTLFGRAMAGESALLYFVNALRQNNLLRILAEPNLIATSGQEASFLAGGEFAIPVTQSGSGGSGNSITIEYRKFGVQLTFLPVVLGNGRIRMKVAPEVSDLDFTTAVRFQGFVIPGLTTRKVQTTVELLDGQTFAIAGLLNSNVVASKDVTPLLGDLPILGALFRSVRYQRKETELVVLVTPRLVEAVEAGQVPAGPGAKWRHPLENDLFFNGDLGGPLSGMPKPTTMPADAGREPPRFHGQYGFHPAASVTEKAP